MKIKFLSIIASFFMVSFLITSCLDDDNSVEYGTDATIHAFALDTIGGYGVSYKFTIDQLKGLIYNEDSLPVRADTIIDRILIKTLTTTSGLVTMKSKDNQDSIINIGDSINLSKYINPNSADKYLKFTVWAPDMINKKEYSLGIRVHKHDPDSITWKYIGELNNEITGLQRSIVFNNKIYTYSLVGGKLKVYQSPIDNISWGVAETSLTSMPTSIITFKNKLYATFDDNGTSKAYSSDDGVTWSSISSLNNVEFFLAPILIPGKEKISFLRKNGDNKYTFATSTDGVSEDYLLYDKYKESLNEEERKAFPKTVTSYANYENRNGTQGSLLIGKSEKSTTVNDGKIDIAIAVAWGYSEETLTVNKLANDGSEIMDGDKNVKENITISRWVALPAGSSLSSCPELNNPTIVYYNSQFYLFGEGFDAFYVSSSGKDWKKASDKFTFPNQDWSKDNTGYNPEKFPEFRGRANYSMVVDTNKDYLVFMFSKRTAQFGGEPGVTYSYNSEVWRGRLNALWFIKDSK